jgi:hypothetical protein
VYNLVLRRFPARDFGVYRLGGNSIATFIFVLVSPVVKIARTVTMKLPPGLKLSGFRCLGGLAELPDSLRAPDAHGCSGFMEWGFLSTTSHR